MADLPVREAFTPRHALTFTLTDRGLAEAPDQTVTAEADQRQFLSIDGKEPAAPEAAQPAMPEPIEAVDDAWPSAKPVAAKE